MPIRVASSLAHLGSSTILDASSSKLKPPPSPSSILHSRAHEKREEKRRGDGEELHPLDPSLPHTHSLTLSHSLSQEHTHKQGEEKKRELLLATHQRMSFHSLFELYIQALKSHGHPSLFYMTGRCGKVLSLFSLLALCL